jgi:hypothetical protein
MTIGRRTFVLGTAIVATAPALAKPLSLLSAARPPASLLPDTCPPLSPASGTDGRCLVFKIDGWDHCGNIAIDGTTTAPAAPVTNDPTGDQVWISINQSWRTAWR